MIGKYHSHFTKTFPYQVADLLELKKQVQKLVSSDALAVYSWEFYNYLHIDIVDIVDNVDNVDIVDIVDNVDIVDIVENCRFGTLVGA